ncbi:MAG: hydroxyacylglutathione hydrolase [Gemmobacter sp.]|jgi:hydroxyacylglutathione hydrolase|nr:hydroxyacylglutathione hydrolase [Gemmobacter sp.]
MPLELVTLPCLENNYAFLLHDEASGDTALVDAPEADPILDALDARGWRLGVILLTHHHYDHIDGVSALTRATGARVIGAGADAHRLPPLSQEVAPGEVLHICGAPAHVIDVPGHTVGHVAFHFPEDRLVFTGDSLMAMGCGRLFEGTPDQMWQSLGRLSTLPPDTLVCSGHEYTQTNARFAAGLGPASPALIERMDRIARARNAGLPTVPSTLAEELATNPFLRASDPAMKAALGMDGAPDAAVFTEIRARRDRF